MKVIITCYLIFLNIYVIKTARPSASSQSSKIISTATTKAININITKFNTNTYLSRPTTTIPATTAVAATAAVAATTVAKNKNLSRNSNYNNFDINTENVEVNSKSRFNNNSDKQVENDVNMQFGLKTSAAAATSTTITAQNINNQFKIDQKRQLAPPKPTKSSLLQTTLSIERKKPVPKKYISSTTVKPQQQQQPSTTKGPIKITLPKSLKLAPPSDTLVCPKETQATFNLFALSCKTNRDCTTWNKENRCCTLFNSRNCHRGVPKPLEEQSHKPILGLIPHKCPQNPLAELWWDLKTCETDEDCWPRVCCPDGRNKYCRTSSPEYESVPFQFGRPLAYFSEYLECTPPPPPIFDLHPKSCTSTFDCFPNVCCQEAGKKNCRPPKKSVLTFMANFLNTGLIKRLTNNLVIR